MIDKYPATLELGVSADLTEYSLYDAIELMDINIVHGMHLFVVYINKDASMFAHKEVTAFNRRFDNILVRCDIDPDSVIEAEWLVRHVESGKSVYSPGA